MLLEQYASLGKANIKHNLFPHIAISFLLILICPLAVGTKNLSAQDTAKVLDMLIPILGMILFIPVFWPEQNQNIRDLVASKHMDIRFLYLMRIIIMAFALCIITAVFTLILKLGNCEFPVLPYYLGAMAGAVFLGGAGLFAYKITDNLTIAYMVPVLLYVISLSGRSILNKFYLFSLMKGSYEEKIYLICSGILMIAATLLYRCRRS